MKIIDTDEKTFVELMVDNDLDLLFVPLIISKGDVIKARTTRRVRGKSLKAESRRVSLNIKVEVHETAYNPITSVARVKGKIIEAPERYGIQGKFHTINLKVGGRFKLYKRINELDLKILEMLKGREEHPLLVILIDYDEANIFELTGSRIRLLMSLESNLPGKNLPDHRAAALRRFIDDTCRIILKYAEGKYSHVIIGGPGFMKDHLVKVLLSKKVFPSEKISVFPASSVNVSGVYEIIKRGFLLNVEKRLSIVEQQRLLEEFLIGISRESPLFTYGLDEIFKAKDYGALEWVIITTKKLSELDSSKLEDFKDIWLRLKGKLYIANVDNEIGKIITSFGGVIAKLRFSLSD